MIVVATPHNVWVKADSFGRDALYFGKREELPDIVLSLNNMAPSLAKAMVEAIRAHDDYVRSLLNSPGGVAE